MQWESEAKQTENKAYLCGGDGVEISAEEAERLPWSPGASPVKANRERDSRRRLRDWYGCKPREVGVNPQLQNRCQYDHQKKQNIQNKAEMAEPCVMQCIVCSVQCEQCTVSVKQNVCVCRVYSIQQV